MIVIPPRFVTPVLPHRSYTFLSIFSIFFFPPRFIIESTWAKVCALSDQKHENTGKLRLRSAETMKANTGNGKLPDTKERKSGHCELQRTAWKSTVDIQFGQTRGTNKKKGKKRERTRAHAVSDIAENHRLRNRYRQSQTSYAGFFRMSDERNWDGNRLRPEIISSLLSLTSRRPFFVKEQRDTVIEFI